MYSILNDFIGRQNSEW